MTHGRCEVKYDAPLVFGQPLRGIIRPPAATGSVSSFDRYSARCSTLVGYGRMVRFEELSNLPAAQVRRTESAIAEQRQGAVDHERAVWELRVAHDRARRWWQWARWLRHRREERAFRKRAPRLDRTLADRFAQQRAGVGAEERVTEDLRVLSDE